MALSRKKNNPIHIGHAIDAIKEFYKLTDADIAAAVMTTPVAVYRWRKNKSGASLGNIYTLCDKFNVSMAWVMGQDKRGGPGDFKPVNASRLDRKSSSLIDGALDILQDEDYDSDLRQMVTRYLEDMIKLKNVRRKDRQNDS